jgi:hypothetical protein
MRCYYCAAYERILGRVRRCQLVAWSIIHGIVRKMIANREWRQELTLSRGQWWSEEDNTLHCASRGLLPGAPIGRWYMRAGRETLALLYDVLLLPCDVACRSENIRVLCMLGLSL